MSSQLPSVASVSVPFSGTTDAKGNFSYTTAVRQSYWATVKVIAKTMGNAQWSVQGGSGLPLDFAPGPQVSVGPFVVAPSDKLTVDVAGAQPHSAVTGNIVGAQYADQAGAAAALVLTTNPLQVSTSGTTSELARINQTGAGPGTTTGLVIPAGSTALGIMVNTLTPFVVPVLVQITGEQTGTVYLSVAPTNNLYVFPFVQILPDGDSTVQVSVTGQPGLTSQVIVFMSTLAIASQVNATAAAPLNVTLANATPAPWEAATNSVDATAVMAQNASHTFVPGVAGQIIYLHCIAIAPDTAVAATAVLIKDGANVIGRVPCDSLAPAAQLFFGRPLTVGNALVFTADGAAITCRGTIVYSQA